VAETEIKNANSHGNNCKSHIRLGIQVPDAGHEDSYVTQTQAGGDALNLQQRGDIPEQGGADGEDSRLLRQVGGVPDACPPPSGGRRRRGGPQAYARGGRPDARVPHNEGERAPQDGGRREPRTRGRTRGRSQSRKTRYGKKDEGRRNAIGYNLEIYSTLGGGCNRQ